MKKVTHFNHKHKVNDAEENNLPSMTVPNMTESISDMLARIRNGAEPPTDDRQRWAENDGDDAFKISELTDLDEAKARYATLREKLEKLKVEDRNKPKVQPDAPQTPPEPKEEPTTPQANED